MGTGAGRMPFSPAVCTGAQPVVPCPPWSPGRTGIRALRAERARVVEEEIARAAGRVVRIGNLSGRWARLRHIRHTAAAQTTTVATAGSAGVYTGGFALQQADQSTAIVAAAIPARRGAAVLAAGPAGGAHSGRFGTTTAQHAGHTRAASAGAAGESGHQGRGEEHQKSAFHVGSFHKYGLERAGVGRHGPASLLRRISTGQHFGPGHSPPG